MPQRVLTIFFLLCCFAAPFHACSPPTTCRPGDRASKLSLDPSGSVCTSRCECNNQKYEGVCNQGACISRLRDACSTPGEQRSCQLLPSAEAGACREGLRSCKPDYLDNQVWGDCLFERKEKEEGEVDCGDGKDNDCDGLIDIADKGCPSACRKGEQSDCYEGDKTTINQGLCRGGLKSCREDGTWGPCVGQVLPATQEKCDGRDEDCNGKVDDNPACACQPGEKQSCYPGVDKGCEEVAGGYACKGECKAGEQVCTAQYTWGGCLGAKTLKIEECNDRDDNCDGKTDEGLTRPCYPDGAPGCTKQSDGTYQCEGACKAGIALCNSGRWLPCTQQVEPVQEACNRVGGNKLDDDCDGKTDEGCDLTIQIAPGGVGDTNPVSDRPGGLLALVGDALYVAGNFHQSLTFGSTQLKTNTSRSMYLARYNRKTHTWEWAVKLEPTGGSAPEGSLRSMVADATGAYIFGSLSQAGLSADCPAGSFQLPQGRQIFLAKVDPQGKCSLLKTASHTGTIAARSVALSPGGTLTIAGLFSGTLKLGSDTLVSRGSADIYVARLEETSGNFQWATSGGGPSWDQPGVGKSLHVDAQGNAYIAANAHQGSTFGPTATPTLEMKERHPLLPSGKTCSQAFLAKLSPQGKWLWLSPCSCTTTSRGGQVTRDAQSGEIYISGTYEGDFKCGTHALPTGNEGLFFAKADAQGKWLWANGGGSSRQDLYHGLTFDAASNSLYSVSGIGGNATFGGLTLKTTASTSLALLQQNAKTGDFLWAMTPKAPPQGTLAFSDGYDLLLAPDGQFHLLGGFLGSIQFGSRSATSQGQRDLFLLTATTFTALMAEP